MDPIYIVGIVAVLLVGVAYGVLYAIPKTRPYAKKWWPVAVIIGATILIALLFRRKPKSVSDNSSSALDEVVKTAEGKIVEAKIRAEAAEVAADANEASVHEELDNINQINDPYERHAAKKKLLYKVRGIHVD